MFRSLEESWRQIEGWRTQVKDLEIMKWLLGTWNIKIKVKEVGIKFQKEAEKFLEIDIGLLNVFKKKIICT